MQLYAVVKLQSIIKSLLLLVLMYIFSAIELAIAAETIMSTIAQPKNISAIEQCVAEVNQYPDDAMTTAERLYKTSMCYFCVGCDLEADNGQLFDQKQNHIFVLDDTHATAYKLMQQAAVLNNSQAEYGLAVLVYTQDLSKDKLSKRQIALKELAELNDNLENNENLSVEEFNERSDSVIKSVYAKQHDLDFNAEIHQRLMNAARAGHMPAQFALGEVYAAGIGVAPDKVQAYAWAATAVAQNPPFGSRRRDNWAVDMNTFELNEAESLAEQFMKEYTDIFNRPSITVMR